MAKELTTVVIAVRNTETGQLAYHHIYNQSQQWSEEQAREWSSRTEYDPWEFCSVSHE